MRLFETVRNLKLRQIIWRVWRRLQKSGPAEPSGKVEAALAAGDWVEPVAKPSPWRGQAELCFLNESVTAESIDWAASDASDLWRYNLHYFDMAAAGDVHARSAAISQLVTQWIGHNPAGTSVAWDAYTTSLRIVNWLKFSFQTQNLPQGGLASLAHQALWLESRLEYQILANHLYANAKALYFAGSALTFEGSNRIKQRGRSLVLSQTSEQFLADGAHFERSPMYHAILTEDLLDLYNMACRSGDTPVAEALRPRIARAFAWLSRMVHPDSQISFFNDAAFGIAAPLSALVSYAARLGLDVETPSDSACMEESGFARLVRGNNAVMFNFAPIEPAYQPGHAHADTLSFEWSRGPHRIVVNSGTSQYGKGAERARQRSTAAHSTLELDGQNSSDVWDGFRVGRRARVQLGYWTGDSIEASHDGYRFLEGKPRHVRSIVLANDVLSITDQISGTASHPALIRFYLHPAVRASLSERGADLVVPGGSRVVFTAGGKIRLLGSTWHPEFGVQKNNQCLVVEWSTGNGLSHTSTFKWANI